jgi:predicted ATP-grasp superfamily ATP-dependent carboligase
VGDVCDLAWQFSRLGYLARSVFKSKHIRHIHNITSAGTDDEQYASNIVALCKEYGYDLILPLGNAAYYATVQHARSLSEHVKFMAPDPEVFSIAHNKAKTVALCQEIGVGAPRTFVDFEWDDLPAIAKELRYPVVIKARSGTGVEKGLRYANSKDELFRGYDEITSFESNTRASNYRSPIIQEFIPGFIHDACTVTNRGEVVNVLTQIRQVMYPIYGGAGAVNVTTHNAKVANLARRLLEALAWHGPAQIEFKYDPRDQEYKLIEINPKLWGTLDLSIKVGMNFPKMIRDILLDKPVKHNQTYPAGVRYVFMFPQAAFAAMQIWREFGLGELRDSRDYSHTYRDLDRTDLLPDLLRGLMTVGGALTGKVNNANANLEKALINRVDTGEFPGLTV